MSHSTCGHHGFSVRRSLRTGIVRGGFVNYQIGNVTANGTIAVHADGTVDFRDFNVQRGVMGALNSGQESWVVEARQEAVALIKAEVDGLK